MDIFSRILTRITSTEKLVNGNEVLVIYYVVIVIAFLCNRFLVHHMDEIIADDSKTLSDVVVKVYKFYRKHTFIVTNVLLYIICCILMIKDLGLDLDYLLTLTLSFIAYTVILKIFLKVFIDEESYQNTKLLSYLNVIYYMIIAGYFAFFSPFVHKPQLLITFAGILVGLLACAYIMIQAIINPQILKSRVDAREDVASYGILRGMLGIVLCIALLEYLMVYACFVTNPDLYGTGEGRILNAWDMFYFYIVSFSTIGYGDIYPQRVGHLFYSEFASIVIGISSLFTTACFVAAVISTASSMASASRAKELSEKKKNAQKLRRRKSESVTDGDSVKRKR